MNNSDEKLKVFLSAQECEDFVNSLQTFEKANIGEQEFTELNSVVGDYIDESKLSRPERRRLEKALKKLGNKVESKPITFPLTVHSNPYKGKVITGECARGVCNKTPAVVWNHGSHKWYCMECGLMLNRENPEFLKANSYEMCQYKGEENPEYHDLPLEEANEKLREDRWKELQRKNKMLNNYLNGDIDG